MNKLLRASNEEFEETNFATPGCIETMNKMLEPSKIDLIMALDTLAGAYAKKNEDGTYVLEGHYKEAYEMLKEFINNKEGK